MQNFFRRIAAAVSVAAGRSMVFFLALLVVVIWALCGPVFNFSNTWQLVINTFTTITTFLMVFLIQNTQNRENRATQLKLDEIILGTRARDSFVDLEDLSDDELSAINEEFKRLHEKIALTHPAMHKLHSKIEAAHRHRQSLAERTSTVAGNVVNAINPFGDHDKDNKNNKK